MLCAKCGSGQSVDRPAQPRIGALRKRSTDWPRAYEIDFTCTNMINEPRACSKLSAIKSQRSTATFTRTQVYQYITERQRAGKYQRGSRNNSHGASRSVREVYSEVFSRPENTYCMSLGIYHLSIQPGSVQFA